MHVQVRELFDSSGRIVACSLERGGYSAGTQPKSATITFDALGSAQAAVRSMDGRSMRGQSLRVELA